METHLETADGDFKSRESLSILSDTNNTDEPSSQKHRQIDNTSQEERSVLGHDDPAGVDNSLGMSTFVKHHKGTLSQVRLVLSEGIISHLVYAN